MGLGVSLFLIAVGAVLAFAVNTTVNGLDIVTVGWILMLVGGLGAVLSLLLLEQLGWIRRHAASDDVRGT
jgi:hypothetical protein